MEYVNIEENNAEKGNMVVMQMQIKQERPDSDIVSRSSGISANSCVSNTQTAPFGQPSGGPPLYMQRSTDPTTGHVYWHDPRTGKTYVQAVPAGQPSGQDGQPYVHMENIGAIVKQEPVDPSTGQPIEYEMEDIKPVITALPLAFNIKQENVLSNFPDASQQMLQQQQQTEQSPFTVSQPDAGGDGSRKVAKGATNQKEMCIMKKAEEKLPADRQNKDVVPVRQNKEKAQHSMFCQRCHRVFFNESVYTKHRKLCEESAAVAAASSIQEKDSASDKGDSDANAVDGDDTDTSVGEDESKLNISKSYSLEKGIYKCNLCRFHTFSRGTILNHVKKHEMFPCDICKENQISFRLLNQHKLSVHGVEPAISSPLQSSDSESNTESDFESDSGEDEYHQCKKCPFSCKADSTQKAHSALHKNPKAFICSFCTRPFLRQLGLTRHITIEHKSVQGSTSRDKQPKQPKQPLQEPIPSKTESKKNPEILSVDVPKTETKRKSDEGQKVSKSEGDDESEDSQQYRQQDGTYLCVLCMAKGENVKHFQKHLRKSKHKFFSSNSWFSNNGDLFSCKVCKFDTKYKYQFLGHVSTKKHDGYVTNWYNEIDSDNAKYFLKGPGAKESSEEDLDEEATPKKKSAVTLKCPPSQKITSPKATEQKSSQLQECQEKPKSQNLQKVPGVAAKGTPLEPAKSQIDLKSSPSQKSTAAQTAEVAQKPQEPAKSPDNLRSPQSQKSTAAEAATKPRERKRSSSSSSRTAETFNLPQAKEGQRSLRSTSKDAGSKRSSQEIQDSLGDPSLNTSRENKRQRLEVEADTSDNESLPEGPVAPDDICMSDESDVTPKEPRTSPGSLSGPVSIIQTLMATRKTANLPSDFSDFAKKPYACALCFFRTGDSEELRLHVQNHLTGGIEERRERESPQQLGQQSSYPGQISLQGQMTTQGQQFLPPGTSNAALYNTQPYSYALSRLSASPHHVTPPHMPSQFTSPVPSLFPTQVRSSLQIPTQQQPQVQEVNTEDLIDPGMDFIKEPANTSPYQCLYCRRRQKNLAGMTSHFESQHPDILHAKRIQAKMRRDAAMGIQEPHIPDQSDASSTTLD